MRIRSTSPSPDGISSRKSQLRQAIRAIQILRRGRWQVDALAAEMGEHRRTVYRLLHALEQVGLVLDRNTDGPEVYYRVTRASVEAWLGL